MTNTVDLESGAADLGFAPDPAFSGHLTRSSYNGAAVMVLAEDGGGVLLQLYVSGDPGETDFELVRSETHELPTPSTWSDLVRRIRDFCFILEIEDSTPGTLWKSTR